MNAPGSPGPAPTPPSPSPIFAPLPVFPSPQSPGTPQASRRTGKEAYAAAVSAHPLYRPLDAKAAADELQGKTVGCLILRSLTADNFVVSFVAQQVGALCSIILTSHPGSFAHTNSIYERRLQARAERAGN